MAKAKSYIPEGFHTVTPHLTVNGASDFIDFVKRAFGAVEVSRATGPGGKLMHAHVRIGDTNLMLNDSFPEFHAPPITEGNCPLVLQLYVPDADSAFAQALASGCEVVFAISDQFWGDRYGQVRDPFGFKWAIATRTEDLTPAEMDERQRKLFSGGGAGE